MNNALRETMCARLALVPELLMNTDSNIEGKISYTLEEARELLKNIQLGKIEPLEAGTVTLKISTSADEMERALRYLEERLKLIRSIFSEIENALTERNL